MAEANPDSFVTFQEFRPPELSLAGHRSNGDLEMTDADAVHPEDTVLENETNSDRLIIAVDFGTTFSSVAYAVVKAGKSVETMGTKDIRCISRYPDYLSVSEGTYDPDKSREDVPTELWYNLDAFERNKAVRPSGQTEAQAPTSDSNNDSDMEDAFTDDEDMGSENFLWGFGVQKYLRRIDVAKDDTTHLSRFKLLLDETSPKTLQLRRELEVTIQKLKEKEIIRGNEDLIGDFLHKLFVHTKAELQKTAVLKENMAIEYVLCVPAVWPNKASRIMQAAMCKAVHLSGLGRLKDGGLDNLFIVSEPEAAAACVLDEDNYDIKMNETVVIIDAGGGTVDAATYRIGATKPLRLSKEVVPSTTEICGGSYINEYYRDLLLDRLKDERKTLEKNGKTIESIVAANVIRFENKEKRMLDTEQEKFGLDRVYIDDLEQSTTKRFIRNKMILSRREMRSVFEPSLQGAAKLMLDQLACAKDKEYDVSKVILIGGFGLSPALRSRIATVLDKQRNYLGQRIQLLTPKVPYVMTCFYYYSHHFDQNLYSSRSTVVARGGVLRAFDKKKGPERKTLCSYGFLITENYDPKGIEEHQGVECMVDPVDGEKYIEGTIRWLVQKGKMLPHYEEFPPITVKHTFAADAVEFICCDAVYVSDSRHPSHYRNGHPENKGAELAGQIFTNMTFLRTEKRIQLRKPSSSSRYKGPRAPKHWAVEFQLVMIIEGRNLRYEARWPVPKSGTLAQTVRERRQISIAAAFRPGTD